MAINSVARAMRVVHAQSKQAYMQAIREAPQEVQKDLKSYWHALHNDAEHRLAVWWAQLHNADSSGPALEIPETDWPARRAAGSLQRASVD
jgi:hypothetical protein